MRTILSSIALCGLISACASTVDKYSLENVKFKTRIIDNGLKHFETRLHSRREDDRSKTPRRQSDQRKTIDSSDRKLKNTLIKVSKELIQQNQFCKRGFWIIEYSEDFSGKYLRGECNDLATQEEIKAHINTLTEW